MRPCTHLLQNSHIKTKMCLQQSSMWHAFDLQLVSIWRKLARGPPRGFITDREMAAGGCHKPVSTLHPQETGRQSRKDARFAGLTSAYVHSATTFPPGEAVAVWTVTVTGAQMLQSHTFLCLKRYTILSSSARASLRGVRHFFV